MPRTKSTVATKKTTTRRKRAPRRGRKNRGLMNLSLQVVPKVAYKKLRYADNMALEIINAYSDQEKFSLNGLYDPDQALGGHQPYGFDQMMTLYNKYCVLGAKVNVLLRPGSTSNTYAMNVYAEMSELTSIQYTNSIGWEKPGVKIATFNSSASNVYNPSRRLSFWFSAKKFFRAKNRNDLISNEDYKGSASNNPATEAYLYLTYQGQQIQQTTAKLAVDIVIDYIVAFTDPKQLAQS